MNMDLALLLATAASIGFIHTLLGADHYLPFVAMSSARGWTTRRTLWITSICGLGHVLGSVVIGAVGIAVGVSLNRLEWIEGVRGAAAAWLLTGFGLAYLAWGLRLARRTRPHIHAYAHAHAHADGTTHQHAHGRAVDRVHVHLEGPRVRSVTPWALFVIFMLGPCEPLIPVLMVPAARHSFYGTVAVVLAFGVATIATMLAAVFLASHGLRALPVGSAERYSHALAGATLSLCGLGILYLGL
jgi:sulfite exporter TauE/SafE